MDKIFNFFGASSTEEKSVEVKFYEKLDEHKDINREEIKEFKKEVNTKIELLIVENTRLTHALIQHQQITAEANNIVHNRINEFERYVHIIHDRFLFSPEQKQIVLDQIKENTVEQRKQIDPKSAIAPPMEGEVEFLKSIIKGDDLDDNHPLVTQAEASLKQTRNKCVDVVFETVLKTSLNLFEYDKKILEKLNFLHFSACHC